MTRLHEFSLMSAEALRNSPSRADGVPETMEARRRKLAAQHLKQVCSRFKLSIGTWAIAVTFFNRFYTQKSMKKNNTFVVACASLLLASKVESEARRHDKLANELLKEWFGKDHPDVQAMGRQSHKAKEAAAAAQQRRSGPLLDPPVDPLQAVYSAVLEAERALLYTVGFDFNVDIVHTHVARLLTRPRFKAMGLTTNRLLQNHLVAISNDIYQKDGLLVLEYPLEKIAVAAYYLVFKMAKATKLAGIPMPPAGANGASWYVEEGLSHEECIALTNRFTERMYNKNAAKRKGGTAAMPATTANAASTAVLGACESVAYSGGIPSLGGVGWSDVGEHTSLEQPLGSDHGSAGVTKGQGHPAPVMASTGGQLSAHGLDLQPGASKRPRQDDTAAAAHVAGQPATLGAPPGPPPAAATPAAANLDDKEEGELEEGELA